ncbi:MAG TPA: FAD-dependent oxidoreductase [Planctomycetota bacterium]|nr:FAD-dependent oxidoreductase [Planctomycetota bacterium]
MKYSPRHCRCWKISTGLLTAILVVSFHVRAEHMLVEAESFTERGGWELDTQFIDIMGSPYLLAHGLGEPVKDATTLVTFPAHGPFKVFVRTKDWVARWNAPGTPGKFQLLINGKALSETFGTKGAEWFWQEGGTYEVQDKSVNFALHDLTGFDGRCDAIFFTNDMNFTPPNDATLGKFRKQMLGLPEQPADGGTYDLVVVGGGYAGMGAAISAARLGCKVALIQDRGVLGGNGSSEVRVWAMGGTRRGLFPNLGEIIDEFCDHAKASPGTFEEFGDAKKEALVRAEKNIALFLNTRMIRVEMKDGKIAAVIGMDVRSSKETRFAAKLFADTTGHGAVGADAGADLTVKETGHMGMSNMWRWKDTGTPQPFPDVPWALPLEMADFPYPKRDHAEWFWETGFNKNPLTELEYMRDWNLRAAFGAFSAMKTKEEKDKHVNAKLEWVAYVGGVRESRQLLGDVILSRDDIVNQKPYPDGCVPTTWDIDLHYPKEQYAKKFPDDPFISKAEFDSRVDKQIGYPVPYRCLYSRNIPNLFMAGRCLSVTHEALGTVRVMKTGGMMGEVVGKAASICVKYDCSPRDVYQNYFDELKDLMNQHGKMRRDTVTSKLYMPAGESPPPPVPVAAKVEANKGVDPKTLAGIVIDDTQAKLTGDWKSAQNLKGFIGAHYLYHSPAKNAAARFEFTVPTSGNYEVRTAHQPHENRATNTRVTVESADGSKTVTVNQRKEAPLAGGWVSLGVYRFDAGKPGAITISAEGADGIVHADAVQILNSK